MFSSEVTLEFVGEMVDTIGVAITVLDANDRVVIYNREAERIFRDNARDVLDQHVHNFHKESTRPAVEASIRSIRAGKVIRKTFDHNDTVIAEELIAIRGRSGEYRGMVQVAIDTRKYGMSRKS